MRLVDAAFTFPAILFALLLAVTMGQGLGTLVIAISLLLWASFARVIRGEVLTLKQRDFVALAKVRGCSSLRIMLTHILPNVLNTFMVLVTLNIGVVIIAEASLSFLGAGIPPPTPTWGLMISEGRGRIADAWWVSLIPGIAITLLVLSVNLFGDWLRDRLDPQLAPAMSGEAVLEVRDLHTYFFLRRGVREGGGRRQLLAAPRRGAGPGRRVRLRQEPDRAVDHAAAAEGRRRAPSPARCCWTARTSCSKTPREMREIRGGRISMILQDPQTSLNPVFTHRRPAARGDRPPHRTAREARRDARGRRGAAPCRYRRAGAAHRRSIRIR